VERGGRLVIGGGAGAQHTVAGLPDSLLPFKLHGLVDIDALGKAQPGQGESIGKTSPVPGLSELPVISLAETATRNMDHHSADYHRLFHGRFWLRLCPAGNQFDLKQDRDHRVAACQYRQQFRSHYQLPGAFLIPHNNLTKLR